MKRKPRDYSHLFEPKKIEPENISLNELQTLSLEEMMLRANGVPKENDEEIETI